MPREPPRQVLVRVGALLGRALQSAIHNTEGGYEVLVRARGRGRVVALRRSEPPVRQRMVRLRPLRDLAEHLHRGGP